ncbi:MAG: Tex-like N-terminal domain-containing protein [Alistipes indistinctus]
MTPIDTTLIQVIASRCGVTVRQAEHTVQLLAEGATVPFISRYRKERTGGLDEVQVSAVKEQFERLSELEKRKETILASIDEQGKLTPELRMKIEQCYEGAPLEDLYLPYRPKRRTRATVAREKGLEPLAAMLMRQDGARPDRLAERFVGGEVHDLQEALDGACDIIAEWVSESEAARSAMRRLFTREGVISARVVKGKEQEGSQIFGLFRLVGTVAPGGGPPSAGDGPC